MASTSEFTDVIKIQLSSSGKLYDIHRRVLCQNSLYFRRKLRIVQAKPTTRPIVLDNVDEKLFNCFFFFVYHSEFFWNPEHRPAKVQLSFEEIWACTFLGAKLRSRAFQDKALQIWCQKYRESNKLDVSEVQYVYNRTTDNPGAIQRDFLVNIYARGNWNTLFTADEAKFYPKDFLMSILHLHGDNNARGTVESYMDKRVQNPFTEAVKPVDDDNDFVEEQTDDGRNVLFIPD